MYTTIIHPLTGKHFVPKENSDAERLCLFLIFEKPFLFILNDTKDSVRKTLRQKKKKIPQSLRTKCFERDEYRCKHCGSYKNLCADHIVPESHSGKTELKNLQTLCKTCNSRKGVHHG